MNGQSIRSAYSQQTAGSAAPKSTNKCPHCGTTKSLSDSVDTMIENAQRMGRKPFQRPGMEPDPVPRAQADNTAVRRRRA